ncbi:mitochondrial thiamine pyrophosphate carrier-like [Thrips palmi]|uniref:Mitochondrial thiamine pyrophosphate carrier n=1 Tax=Thrips palmi TaxID=161013 RepID=A0A6P8YSR0_THRPL|nr:mitochondrial thiamine pyrophosphate carrier-like [Thrips palmi]
MVGYDENASKRLRDSEYAVAGATSGGLTRAVSQPLDVIKIRFQLQVEPLKKDANAKYWSVSQALRRIIREEGVTALWKGHVPAQVLSILYGVAQATCFEVLTREVWNIAPEWRSSHQRPIVHFVCGGAAGIFAAVVSFPFDVVRTRLVAQGKLKVYSSTSHAVREILKKEGQRGLFRGLAPVLIQMAPHSGIQFATYTALMKLTSSKEEEKPAVERSLIIGALAGAVSKSAVYPLDLAKKRLQVIGFEAARLDFGQTFSTSGLFHCIRKIVKTEGILALYKGLWPSTIKAGVVSALYFTFYENTCALMLRLK